MAEELTGKYLRAYSKSNKRNTYCPLYRNPPDRYEWMDTFIKLPVSQDTLGVYYAPAIKASHVSAPDGGANINTTVNPNFYIDSHSEHKDANVSTQTIHVDNYTYMDVSAVINTRHNHSAEDGWCFTTFGLLIDGIGYDMNGNQISTWHAELPGRLTSGINGSHSFTLSKKKIYLGPGNHTISVHIYNNASDGDSALFWCDSVKWNIVNYRTKAQLTDMHCKIGSQEYVLLAGPGY